MKNQQKSAKKEGTLAPSVKENNLQRVGNIAANCSPRKSPFMLLRFEAEHLGRFHFTTAQPAGFQFEKGSGRRQLVSHILRATVGRA